ncbi:MAG: extracellular solute-binding protein [Lachnospiraceae bacterium]|nr:extracellular solute-binding protein [Lachnospiraceae bacterium]
MKKATACLLVSAMLVPIRLDTMTVSAKTDLSLDDYEEIVGTYSIDESMEGYEEYLSHTDGARPADTYTCEAKDYVRFTDEDGNENSTPEAYTDYEGVDGVSVLTEESGLIEYEVTVENAGLYELSLEYYPVEGKNTEIQRSFLVDGKLPYEELALVEFSRIWSNEITDYATSADGIRTLKWETDNQGNDLKPSLAENPAWITSYVYDSNGYIPDRLSIYLTAGTHTITILSIKEPMLLRRLILSNSEEVQDYQTVTAKWDKNGAVSTSGHLIRLEAENADRTSSQMLYPVQDKSSPAVYPSSAKELKNNTIGGNSWRLVGQWIEWDFEVPESGYYDIAMFAKQNFSKGLFVSRKIEIDGKVPFKEMNAFGFDYRQNWKLITLSGDDDVPYKIYLTKGQHTLRMQAVLGEFAGIIADVKEAVTQLNAIYRSVIRITGVSPDTYRDYQIEASLPELKNQLGDARELLQGAIDKLKSVAGNGSEKLTVLITMRDQLDELIKDEERFTKVIGSFKINVRACGTWLTQVISQPLQLDTIYIYSPDVTVKVAHDTVWAKIGFEIKKLFYSFIVNYNQIGNVSEEANTDTLTLWVGTGRDQANVIKALIDEHFTNETGIAVNVMLVDMNTLLQATLAGQGPDVAIQVANDMPMNYGLRNAVADLGQFDDLPDILKRFNASAMEAFTFNGSTYALPETQTFPMLFYRKDILKELNMSVPTTWDEVKVAMAVLSKNQMEIGMLPSEQVFAMFLYQNGGQYYNEDATKSALDSEEAVNAFKEYCEYYTDYKLDKETSVEERFRTGECPLIIADYTVYNNLQVSAPDIKGMWGFAPVPGVKTEDGMMDNSVGSTGLGCVIMEDSKLKDQGWEFLKWWTSAQTQTLYGREMESLMGAAARVATANMEAFANLPWPVADYEALLKQFSSVRGIPQVPGGYFSWRNVNNAFYKVTTDTDTATPRESLQDKVIYVNDEITYKREEFKLPVAKE